MDATAMVGAEYWAGFWEWIADKAFVVVVIALALEYITGRWAKPHREALESARKLQIAQLTDNAAKTNETAAKAVERAAILENETTQLRNAAEISRHKNLEFEAALAPRILEQNLSAQALNQYSGTKFVIISPNDFEMRRMAGQIRFMLVQAGWSKATEDLPENKWFPDGITIRYNLGAALQDGRTLEAAKALVEQLKASNIEAWEGPPNKRLPAQVILIVVGAKPLPPSLTPSPDRFPGDTRDNKTFGNVLDENWSGSPPVRQEPPK